MHLPLLHLKLSAAQDTFDGEVVIDDEGDDEEPVARDGVVVTGVQGGDSCEMGCTRSKGARVVEKEKKDEGKWRKLHLCSQ